MNEQDFRNLKTGAVVMFLKASDESSYIQKIPAGTLLVREFSPQDCDGPGRSLLNFKFIMNGEDDDNFFYADEVQLVKG